MQDPIGGFRKVRDFFMSYLDTAFRIRDDAVARERRELLRTSGVMCAEPIIESIPRYEPSEYRVDELANVVGKGAADYLPGFSESERRAFAELALAGLFDSEPNPAGAPLARRSKDQNRLYLHQAQMLRRGVRPGTPGIVTSGTGSGKTESFLLPVLATITREALGWNAPKAGYLDGRWWHDSDGKPYETFTKIPKSSRPLKANPDATPFFSHRKGETRDAAVRALVLYPMNALVEDQLVRIRKALDSDAARSVFEKNFHGNRIFFGRYTGDTPITGFDHHPRRNPTTDSEMKRRTNQLRKLFAAMTNFERAQERARSAEVDDEDTRFLFPSVDGAELVSRWDMQEHPPDLLITNVSMLSAMLIREVDSPIFKKTREWLQKDDSYFFLIFDELHLQRGSAGTEVSYLIRLLLQRLGLEEPKNRHKLRILASSASLPVDTDEDRARSLTYLWDFFGRRGHFAPSKPEPEKGNSIWLDSIVPGKLQKPDPKHSHSLNVAPFVGLLAAYEKDYAAQVAVAPRTSVPNPMQETAIRAAAGDLLPQSSPGAALPRVLAAAIDEAGRRILAACTAGARCIPLAQGKLATELFGAVPNATDGLRGLLFLRGLGDLHADWWPQLEKADRPNAPSFRVHWFFRSLEGIFGPADGAAGVPAQFASPDRLVGGLTIERGQRYELGAGAKVSKGARILELLYCESCGDLFFGGRRAGDEKQRDSNFELLPNDPNIEGLPDEATTQNFEDLSYDDFALFWPRDRKPRGDFDFAAQGFGWSEATLDPATGVVKLLDPKSPPAASAMRGRLHVRKKTGKDQHERKSSDPGTAAPYACPACSIDYSPRNRDHRLSPIRNFRTGFAKTTQLLATELFSLLKLHTDRPKLVSFSDSRQDAAKAALDIESRHHEDLRRQILIHEVRAAKEARPSAATLQTRIKEIENELGKLYEAKNFGAMKPLTDERESLDKTLSTLADGGVAVSELLGNPTTDEAMVGRFLERFVLLGTHPVDPAGIKKVKVGDKLWLNWWELLDVEKQRLVWRTKNSRAKELELRNGRMELLKKAQELLSGIIFSKTYFSLEEAGLAYPAVPRAVVATDAEYQKLNAFLRVFADSYRLEYSPYVERAGGGSGKPTKVASQAPKRVQSFAAASIAASTGGSVGTIDPETIKAELSWVIGKLEAAGHDSAVIKGPLLKIVPVEDDASIWRCVQCQRVHLHRGTGACTRCGEVLPASATGVVA